MKNRNVLCKTALGVGLLVSVLFLSVDNPLVAQESGNDCDRTQYTINSKEDCTGWFRRRIDCKSSKDNCCLKERMGEEC